MTKPKVLWDRFFPKYDTIERHAHGGVIDDAELSASLAEAVAPYRAIDEEYREKLQADLGGLIEQENTLIDELTYRETRLREVRRSKAAIGAALLELAPEKRVADGYAGAA